MGCEALVNLWRGAVLRMRLGYWRWARAEYPQTHGAHQPDMRRIVLTCARLEQELRSMR